MYGKNYRCKNDVCISGCKGLTALTTSSSIDTIWPNNHQYYQHNSDASRRYD